MAYATLMTNRYTISFDDLAEKQTFIYDLDAGKLIRQSESFKALFPVALEDLSVEALKDFIMEEDAVFLSEYFRQLTLGEAKPATEIRLRINGAEKWFRLSIYRVRSVTGAALFGNVEDITAEMHSLQTMQKYTNKKNSILVMLAHDLRGPLGVARNLSQLVGREIQDAKLAGFLQTITKTVQQSIDLIGDLTRREFLDSTSVELVKKRIDIALKLREYMEENLKSEWVAKRTFKFSASHEHIFIDLDEAKFMQVQNNLVSNALKFTHEDGVISLHIDDLGEAVLFRFTDDGIGIPPHLQIGLFDEFTEARRKGLRGEPTVGLGLSIVKTIIEWHQGKIWLESTEGNGTTFFIEIPKSKAD